jgi:hypothetical protein
MRDLLVSTKMSDIMGSAAADCPAMSSRSYTGGYNQEDAVILNASSGAARPVCLRDHHTKETLQENPSRGRGRSSTNP